MFFILVWQATEGAPSVAASCSNTHTRLGIFSEMFLKDVVFALFPEVWSLKCFRYGLKCFLALHSISRNYGSVLRKLSIYHYWFKIYFFVKLPFNIEPKYAYNYVPFVRFILHSVQIFIRKISELIYWKLLWFVWHILLEWNYNVQLMVLAHNGNDCPFLGLGQELWSLLK